MNRIIISSLLAAAALVSFASCSKDDGENISTFYNATVTFRPQEDGSYYLKQDDSTALVVLNKTMAKYPFEANKEQRALVQYVLEDHPKEKPVVAGTDAYKSVKYVTLATMDPIQTKDPVLFDETKVYGDSAIGLYISDDVFPTTMIEDGYLNLCFNIPVWYGSSHEINLVYGVNKDDPYELEVKHRNLSGLADGQPQAFIMCFPLKDLPDTKGETVKLTLKWFSITQGKMVEQKFDYCSRTDW